MLDSMLHNPMAITSPHACARDGVRQRAPSTTQGMAGA